MFLVVSVLSPVALRPSVLVVVVMGGGFPLLAWLLDPEEEEEVVVAVVPLMIELELTRRSYDEVLGLVWSSFYSLFGLLVVSVKFSFFLGRGKGLLVPAYT